MKGLGPCCTNVWCSSSLSFGLAVVEQWNHTLFRDLGTINQGENSVVQKLFPPLKAYHGEGENGWFFFIKKSKIIKVDFGRLGTIVKAMFSKDRSHRVKR